MSNSSQSGSRTENRQRKRLRKIERRLGNLESVQDRQQAISRRLGRIERKLNQLDEIEEAHAQEPIGECVHCWEGELIRIGSTIRCTKCGYRFE
jgi:DNA repair exonuclease SbcCD ATPase subunit